MILKHTSRTAMLAGLMIAGLSGAAFADCGQMPKAPTIPADGSKATGKEMEAASKDLETYSNDFAKFNECAIKEYNGTMEAWQKSLSEYQAKNKKK
jgi:hypothetical protein